MHFLLPLLKTTTKNQPTKQTQNKTKKQTNKQKNQKPDFKQYLFDKIKDICIKN